MIPIGSRLAVRESNDITIEENSQLDLRFDLENLHVFDSNSGTNLLTDTASPIAETRN